MTTLSVVMTTYNEEKNAPLALETVWWANECIVVDGNSSDDTIIKIKPLATCIVQSTNYKQLNINKNLGFSMATSEWILSIDADERIPDPLGKKIRTIINSPKFEAYRIPRKNYFLGKWIAHGGWYPDYQIRLFRRGEGWFACKHVHESLSVRSEVGTISEPMIHFSYPTLTSYFSKFDRYTDFESQFMIKPILWKYFIDFPCRHFIDAYFKRSGFRDGWRGMFIALFSSLYYQAAYLKYLKKRIFY